MVVARDPAPTSLSAVVLERRLVLRDRAEALGAAIAASTPRSVAFDFAPDEADEAVDLGTFAAREGFSVGLAEGEVVRDPRFPGGVTGLGQGIAEAMELARAARDGELLVRPTHRLALLGRLAVTARVRELEGPSGRRRARVLVVDRDAPARLALDDVPALDLEPPLVRGEALGAAEPRRGALLVVRAARGLGGSRALAELSARHGPALLTLPSGAGLEPLGAVRAALARADLDIARSDLPATLREAAARISEGHGADAWTAGDVLAAVAEALVRASGERARPGLLVVDELAALDRASCEALSCAATTRGSVALVARLAPGRALPSALLRVPLAGELTLAPLGAAECVELATRMAGAPLSETLAAWLVAASGGAPLALRELLARALAEGNVVDDGGLLLERRPLPELGRGRGGAGRARLLSSLTARLVPLERSTRRALVALALLGGEAPRQHVDAVTGEPGGLARCELELSTQGLLVRSGAGRVALSSSSLRRALVRLSTRDETLDRAGLHRGAARLHRGRGPLALADASVHERAVGELSAAAGMVEAALGAAREVELSGSLHELEAALAADLEITLESPSNSRLVGEAIIRATSRPRATSGASDDASLARASVDDEPTGPTSPPRVEQAPPSQAEAPGAHEPHEPLEAPEPHEPHEPHGPQEPHEPHELLEAHEPHELHEPLEAHEPLEGPTPVDPGEPLERARGEGTLSDARAPASVAPRPSVHDVDPDDPVARARVALLHGDVEQLEYLVLALRASGEHAALVRRMTSFLDLARGARSAALLELREAAYDESSPPDARARSLLAYGVALAATGRFDNALLASLSALSSARRAEDAQGVGACARFLEKLSIATGHDLVAHTWAQLADAALLESAQQGAQHARASRPG